MRNLFKFQTPTYDNPISIDIQKMRHGSLREGLIKTYPKEKVASYISNYLGIGEEQIRIDGDNVIIALPRDADIELVDEMESVMSKLCGFYLAMKYNYEGNEGIIYYKWEPKYQDEITRMVNDEKYLVHVSPSVNHEKIMKQGICPKFKNDFLKYPDRVYLMLMSKFENVYDMIDHMRNIIMDKPNDLYGWSYNFYIIDVSKIPENVKFYKDNNLKGSVWTYGNIPPQAIYKYGRIKINGKK